jgi:hypothetical protein
MYVCVLITCMHNIARHRTYSKIILQPSDAWLVLLLSCSHDWLQVQLAASQRNCTSVSATLKQGDI